MLIDIRVSHRYFGRVYPLRPESFGAPCPSFFFSERIRT